MPARQPKMSGAAEFVPPDHSLQVLRDAVQECRGCNLYRHATQAVFGEKLSSAKRTRMMLVGEQPGDHEDKAGQPFVGPAGKLLDRCLEEAGIDRAAVYVTNTVKHFKWEPRGKLRLHKKPTSSEIFACRPWLRAEVDAVKPNLIVCLGATAAQSFLGAKFRVTKEHGIVQRVDSWPPVIATTHPSSILRAPSDEDRRRQLAEFIDDLRRAKSAAQHR